MLAQLLSETEAPPLRDSCLLDSRNSIFLSLHVFASYMHPGSVAMVQ